MYKQNSEFKSIQKKLMAAVAMVLIASIMVVSSSYAWFTLSTAPEVTGITTAVGSNGNLEMALNVSGNAQTITSTSEAGSDPYANNPYWGNLVNLSDARYGLSQISLAPARLNLIQSGSTTKSYTISTAGMATVPAVGDDYNGGKVTAVSTENEELTYEVSTPIYAINNGNNIYLQTAVYGTDGRVTKLEANAEAGGFNGTGFGGTALNPYGVRGVGVVSGLSDAQIALRDAKTQVTDTKGNTLYLARKSLQVDAVNLANILVASEMGTDSFDDTEYNDIETAIKNLETIVNGLEEAMKATVAAVYLADTGTSVATTAIVISTTEITVNGTAVTLSATDLQTQLQAAYASITAMRTDLGNARSAMPEKTGSYTFTQLSAPMYKLLDREDILVDGKEFSAYENKLDIGFALMGNAPLTLKGGLYSNIAEFVEDYRADAKIHVKGTFSGQDIDKDFDIVILATAQPPVDGTSYYLPYYINQLSSVTVTGDEGGTSISDLYGYIIDLAFRTNAADSYLQLQTDAATRVNGNDTAALQGAGSYMEFTITSTGYTSAQMVELLSAVRVVIFDTTSGEIFGVAALDLSEYTALRDSTDEEEKAAFAALTTMKAPLYLYSYTVVDNMLNLDVKLDSASILELQQNTATAVSSLVYLDGDHVDNGAVGISGKTVEGTMNLQFSSSADLVPMQYNFGEDTEATLAAPTASLVDNTLTITAAAEAPAGVKYDVYTKVGSVEIPLKSGVDAGEYTVDLSGATFEDAALPANTYTIYVRATLTGYTNSNEVEAGTIAIS